MTAEASAMGEADVAALRATGLPDAAIHDAAQVASYFNYINRIAQALGVDLETFVRAWGEPADGSGPTASAPAAPRP